MFRSRIEENEFRSRESESNRVAVFIPIYRIRVVKATEGSEPSRIAITLLKLFWYTLKMYIARYGMYRLVWNELFDIAYRYDPNGWIFCPENGLFCHTVEDRPRPSSTGVLGGRGCIVSFDHGVDTRVCLAAMGVTRPTPRACNP
ncbi:hypothetical protein EPI10_024275 [Gossypium australe]|uniref:Uncharacterized protein n=1 Tax=Gossypium australe TaxID=47621 RepID=A0A5B6VYM5_9ROSI|nr:hypothetical protein EPI10_024275 [Gossypium australe]